MKLLFTHGWRCGCGNSAAGTFSGDPTPYCNTCAHKILQQEIEKERDEDNHETS